MSREQIEKMANILWHIPHGYSLNSYNDCEIIAECIYNDGDYRKQSEGEWISNRQTGEYICNLCGGIAPVDCEKEDFYKSNYCPNCGAKMKGGAEVISNVHDNSELLGVNNG